MSEPLLAWHWMEAFVTNRREADKRRRRRFSASVLLLFGFSFDYLSWMQTAAALSQRDELINDCQHESSRWINFRQAFKLYENPNWKDKPLENYENIINMTISWHDLHCRSLEKFSHGGWKRRKIECYWFITTKGRLPSLEEVSSSVWVLVYWFSLVNKRFPPEMSNLKSECCG